MAPSKPTRCPKCGSVKLASVVYGLPSLELIKEAEESDRIILGGDVIPEKGPMWVCNACRHEGGNIRDVMEEAKLRFPKPFITSELNSLELALEEKLTEKDARLLVEVFEKWLLLCDREATEEDLNWLADGLSRMPSECYSDFHRGRTLELLKKWIDRKVLELNHH